MSCASGQSPLLRCQVQKKPTYDNKVGRLLPLRVFVLRKDIQVLALHSHLFLYSKILHATGKLSLGLFIAR